MVRVVILPQDDYDAVMSLLHDIRVECQELPDCYRTNEVRRRIEEIGRILTYCEEEEDE